MSWDSSSREIGFPEYSLMERPLLDAVFQWKPFKDRCRELNIFLARVRGSVPSRRPSDGAPGLSPLAYSKAVRFRGFRGFGVS